MIFIVFDVFGGAATGLPTATRREYIPVGSFINFIHEVYPSGQLSCLNSFLTNLSAVQGCNGCFRTSRLPPE